MDFHRRLSGGGGGWLLLGTAAKIGILNHKSMRRWQNFK